MKKGKLLAIIAIGLFIGIFATSCGSCGSYDKDIYGCVEDLDPSGQVITYWYQHSGDREATLQEMISDFNATNEWGITVKGEHAGSYGEIYNKVIANIPTDEVPEIAVCYQNQAATYVTQAAIIELTPYIESSKWGFTQQENDDLFTFVSLGDYLPEYNGRYGFPPHRSMEVLFYNTDWLNELGYDNPPGTWSEFKEMACAASDPAAGTYGYELDVDVSTFADMVFNHGGSMVNEDATEYSFGDEAGLEVLTFIKELFDEGCAIQESEGYGDTVDFAEERILFTISSSSGLPRYRDAIKNAGDFNWSISTLPTTLDAPKVNIYGASLSILRTGPERQLASWLFIKWLTEPEQSARWSRASNYFPVRRSAAEEMVDYLASNPQYEKAFGFLNYEMAIEPGVASYQECRDAIGDAMDAVVSGGDPETWLASALEECNTLMAELGPE
jgi:ABC-type glycerol-3-phosphate transport system substrate-binding protein